MVISRTELVELFLAAGLIVFVLQSSGRVYEKFRRALDIIISITALLLALPVMLAVALLIKFDSPGPVLYSQVRVGYNRRHGKAGRTAQDRRGDNNLGTPFRIYKFRTMRLDAESGSGAVWASSADSRVTRLGRFLRKSRLDELPQFYNVLKGDMSFIGPRPERPEFVKELNNNIGSYDKRCDVKPGITGLAQVRFSYAASLEDTKRKVKYDLMYLKKVSFLLDLQIFFSTFKTVLFAKGAR